MRIIVCVLLAIGAAVSAEERVKRQATYTFPGPRVEGAARQAAAYHAQQQQQPRQARGYAEEPDDGNLYQPASRRQYQPAAQHITQAQPRQSPPPPPPQPAPAPPVYEAPRAAPAQASRQSYTAQPATQRKRASTSSRANKYGGSAPQQSLNGGAEEEEEQGPDPLTLLLEDSKFSCGGKNDGYYADDSVNCQVFHYCVSGARHSWMCPDGTVFHQVHLNCVPDSQDICSQSQKFHFVNEYLYKPVDYEGPNNTARYAQRYYPDGYVVGDPLLSPQDNHAHRPQSPPHAPPAPAPAPQPQSYSRPRVQSYPAPPPTARQPAPPPRQVAPPPPPPPPPQQPPSYSVPSQPSGYSPSSGGAPAGPSRGSRPSRPTYQSEAPQSYRRPRIEPPPHSVPVDDDEDSYQPAPETRRYAASPRSTSGYAVPRQYRPVAATRPAAAAAPPAGPRPQYPSYASNQAAGVQYDEDY